MIVGIVVFLAIVTAVIWFVSSYYNLVAARQRVSQSWANLDALLRQRHDELARFVDLCDRHLDGRREVLDVVGEARSEVFGARHLADAAALGPAEELLRAALAKLFAIVDDTPAFADDPACVALRRRLATLETGIAERRERYNDAVSENNRAIERFPNSLVAFIGGFRTAPPFELAA